VKRLTVGSLFAGIGGFDLAAERVGCWRSIGHMSDATEISPIAVEAFCARNESVSQLAAEMAVVQSVAVHIGCRQWI
jgi:site-specific DNA-cytosine methylase